MGRIAFLVVLAVAWAAADAQAAEKAGDVVRVQNDAHVRGADLLGGCERDRAFATVTLPVATDGKGAIAARLSGKVRARSAADATVGRPQLPAGRPSSAA